MFDAKKKLIVVYEKKDEIALNYLKQLVLSNDDNAETGEIIGTKDGSIEVIAWTEKVYLDNTKNRNVSNKIIFMDDIKGIEKIVQILENGEEIIGLSHFCTINEIAEMNYDLTPARYMVKEEILDTATLDEIEAELAELYKKLGI